MWSLRTSSVSQNLVELRSPEIETDDPSVSIDPQNHINNCNASHVEFIVILFLLAVSTIARDKNNQPPSGSASPSRITALDLNVGSEKEGTPTQATGVSP